VKQLIQPASGGPVQLIDVPRPSIGPTEVLVQTVASVISPGTERAVTALAQSNLLAKARARPDLVRQVVKKARTDGISATARTVRTRLAADVPLGYSAAGIAVEVGEHVAGVSPGQLVATGGAGKANHAEFQAVPGLLCLPVPDGVDAESAAFATIASIALHGLRLAEVGTGAKVVVVGLGLVGQLAVRLAQAAGCDVAGIDLEDFAVEQVRAGGALGLVESGEATTSAVLEWSRGRGADAVVLAAAGGGSEAIRRTPALCRDRATVVVVGDVGLSLERAPFYDKELAVRFARSYGPGRYERSYEEWGVDYPAGHVRWTEGRNMEAILDLLASGRLRVEDLITHRFDLASSPAAYQLIEARAEPYLGVALTYPALPPRERHIQIAPVRKTDGTPGVGLIGAGAFATSVLIPAFRSAGFSKFSSVASASGLSARRFAERAGFEKAVSGADAVIEDPDVDVVVIATPHETHAALAARALRAGKHVFCEKPLALTEEELDDVEAAWRESACLLFVGFNRRWSEPVRVVEKHFAGSRGPLVITYRVSVGPVPEGHWYHDRRQGGRLVGEVCHFIDTCGAIVGTGPSAVSARAGTTGELALATDVVVTLAYPDRSLAAITYASGGHHRIEKERVEVLGRGRSAVIVDFREIVLDGVRSGDKRQDKGHLGLVSTFRRALAEGWDSAPGALASSRAAIDAVADLRRGPQA
jgi:predicted dehydrogenase/threonine dehydrogenase-like Zn-dependent dehydrogenase